MKARDAIWTGKAKEYGFMKSRRQRRHLRGVSLRTPRR